MSSIYSSIIINKRNISRGMAKSKKYKNLMGGGTWTCAKVEGTSSDWFLGSSYHALPCC